MRGLYDVCRPRKFMNYKSPGKRESVRVSYCILDKQESMVENDDSL